MLLMGMFLTAHVDVVPPLFHVKILWVAAWFETSIRKSLFCDSATCRNEDNYASVCCQMIVWILVVPIRLLMF